MFNLNRICMKKHFLNAAFLAFLSLALCTVGCSDDEGYADVDGLEPTMALVTDHIQSGAGHRFTIEGTLTDADGIATINLQCADLYLNKTIDLIEIYGEPQTTYELSYHYDLDRNELGERFTVKVTVTDVGGRSVSQDVLVTMDGDFSAPVFISAPSETVNVLIREETVYTLNLSVSDDRSLDHILINIPGISGYENLQVDAEGAASFTFSDRITFPNEVKNYDLTVTAVDGVGNETSVSCVIAVDELQDYERMYLADVATAEELNSDVFGVPMRIDHVGEFQYRARYYCAAANTEIFFLPQANDFSPICFGLDPSDNSVLTSDPDLAQPIVLTEANVYYDITFNTNTGEYSMSTYSVNDADDPWPSSMVYGLPTMDKWNDGGSTMMDFTFGLTSDNPTTVESFVQDANNPHLFYYQTPLSLTAGEEMNFIIHNYHTDQWWNFTRWCSTSSTDLEIFSYYTGSTFRNMDYSGPTTGEDVWSKPVVNTTGNYQFYFDSHLGRAKLVRVD